MSTCAINIDDNEEDEKVALKLLCALLVKKGTTDAMKYLYEEYQVVYPGRFTYHRDWLIGACAYPLQWQDYY